ncbi:hypothetical protein BN946_scf184873.g5 [Trametes cinnabarina]|uniref:Aminoglycoside phosphotransferase domain-containing protein n=1 Tax=Pycnoporus cinnabarinus TaxID=5643 RepID=A0A060SP37_PYCCI|nr:hypothetical protein BN946_scf184873.g5 [Trametes cinnabarina]
MRVFLRIWLLLPSRLRLSAYNKLLKLGCRLYGHTTSADVHRLPFGLYLRHGSGLDNSQNEFNALKLVRQHTSVPVPEPLDLIGLPPHPNDPFKKQRAYLLTTRLPGTPLAYCEDMLSDRDFEHVAAQMKDHLAQLRTIPKTVNPDMAICNVSGERCIDPRLRDWNPVGPFPDEAAFSQLMRFPDDPARRGHKIVFSHGDLNPRNILVNRFARPDGSRGWRVTGIVDWETAGFYPEYWDYTKAMFEGFRWTKRYNRLVKTIFSALGDYSKELQIERQSWAMGDGI